MKKIFKFLIGLCVFLVVIAIGIGAGIWYVNDHYGVNLITTAQQLITMSRKVDENKLIVNPFSDDDMASAMETANASITGFITYDETNGYSVDLDDLQSTLQSDIAFKDREIAALTQNIFMNDDQGTTTIAGYDFPMSLRQIYFTDVIATAATFEIIVELKTDAIKDKLASFPLSLLKSLVPDSFYISSAFRVTHGEQDMSYTVSHVGLSINELDADNTAELLTTINKIIELGTAESINLTIGNLICDILIGNPDHQGILSSLAQVGASDYAFRQENSDRYFIIERSLS